MFHVAIVGCGPAGLSSAILLHQQGHKVTLFERFDKPRPVGSGLMLQPTGLQVLEQLGVRAEIEHLGQRIEGMLGRVAPAGKVVLDINYGALAGDLYGVAIHRASLFHVLYEAVLKRSIPIVTSCEITRFDLVQNKVSLCSVDGPIDNVEYDFVVDASGCQSRLLSYAMRKTTSRQLDYGALWGTVEYSASDFNPHFLEQRYKAARVMVGVLPCGKLPNSDAPVATFFWSLRNDTYHKLLADGIDAWKREVLQYWPAVAPLLDQFESFDQLAHAVYSHHTLHKPCGNKIVFIGDAAHSTSPQLGQGANMALLDSYALQVALAGHESMEQSFRNYAQLRRFHVRLFQAASLTLTPFYQSDSQVMPWLRDSLFEPVSKIPMVDKLVTALGSGLLGRPYKRIRKISKTRNK